jgi:CubicO group peptidase (beta-lactamase class C family)
MRQSVILVLALLLFACDKQEVVIDVAKKDNVRKIIESEKRVQKLNAVSYCVVKGDSLIWSEAVGNATDNLQASTETRFLIASVSKAVTAVAALKLSESGILNLDADINTYLPFQVRNPKFSNVPITTRMLLNHSGSISDAHYQQFNFYCWNKDCTIPLGVFLNDFFNTSGQFYSSNSFYDYSPGSQANYTNMGYALLGYIVERVANRPFDEYCKQNIFIPLGMTKSEWRLKNIPVAELAIPYSPTFTSSTPHYTFPDYPNGGLRSTPRDISLFLRMIINNGTFKGNRIISTQTAELMKKYTLSLTRGGLTFDFGLGIYYSDVKGKRLLGHGGGEQGTSTAMHYDPESRVGVVVFTNTTSANLNKIIYPLYKFGIEQ